MLKHVWSVLAAKSVIDNDTQLISIYDVADTLNIEGNKSDIQALSPSERQIINIPVRSELVSMFYKTGTSPETGNLRLEFVDPEGQKLAEHDQGILAKKVFLRTRIKIEGMAITKSGIYKVQVFFKEPKSKNYNLVAEVPYLVNVKLK